MRQLDVVRTRFLRSQPMKDDSAPIRVVFACPKCQLPYSATQVRSLVVVKQVKTFACLGCGATVLSWFGDYEFMDWQPASK